MYMLSSKIITIGSMLLDLSRYKYLLEIRFYRRLFASNVNTRISGKCKDSFSIIMFKYVVKYRY